MYVCGLSKGQYYCLLIVGVVDQVQGGVSCVVSQLTVVAQTSVWLYRVIMSEVLVGCPYTFCSSFLVPAAGSIFFFFSLFLFLGFRNNE